MSASSQRSWYICITDSHSSDVWHSFANIRSTLAKDMRRRPLWSRPDYPRLEILQESARPPRNENCSNSHRLYRSPQVTAPRTGLFILCCTLLEAAPDSDVC